MTTTNDTPPTDDTPGDEVKNPAALLRRNKELMAELKAGQAELRTAQEAQQASQADVAKWRGRWHSIAVEAPLEAELRKAATVPVQYLRDLLVKSELLRMEPDADGLMRPRWYTVKGKLDDNPSGGALGHIVRALHDLGDGQGGFKEAWAGELANAIPRATGTNAPGSRRDSFPTPRPRQDTPAAVQRPTFGLS